MGGIVSSCLLETWYLDANIRKLILEAHIVCLSGIEVSGPDS